MKREGHIRAGSIGAARQEKEMDAREVANLMNGRRMQVTVHPHHHDAHHDEGHIVDDLTGKTLRKSEVRKARQEEI